MWIPIITYLVSCRRSIEIWRVCKIYGRRGGAEPSIYFTNPPYFYRSSATDQISVLFRRGPWIMYVLAKIWKKSKQTSYIYGRVLRAKMWRYDLRGRRHRLRYENQGRNDVVPLLKSRKKSTLVRCYPRATRCGGDIVTLLWFRASVRAWFRPSVGRPCEHDRD